MKKILFLLGLLCAFPAFADNDQEPDLTARTVLPYPVRYPLDTTTKSAPGVSLGIGYNALAGQYLPAAYENLAIGYNALSSSLQTGAIQNLAIGYNACKKVVGQTGSFGSQNICIGPNSGSNITTGVASICIGNGACSGVTTNSYNVIMDAANPATQYNVNLSVLIGSNTSGIAAGSADVAIGYDAGLNWNTSSSDVTIIGANVGRNNLANGHAASNVVLVGASPTSGSMLDTATTSTTTTIGIGQGYPGTGDTMVGWGALNANTVDNADQVAFGYNALHLSNEASAENSAFGYSAGAAITTGTNNLCLGYNACSSTLATGGSNIIIGSGTDALSSNTSNEINLGGLVFYNNTSVAAPTVSSCGTSPSIDTKANDKSGTVTVGSGTVSSCTVTFASAYNTWNHCRISFQSNSIGGSYSYTKSAITVTASSLTSTVFDYDCDGY